MDNLEESDKLLETYNLPKLNLEKTGNMNRRITSIENESVILKNKQTKNLPTNKTERPTSFTGEFYQRTHMLLLSCFSRV